MTISTSAFRVPTVPSLCRLVAGALLASSALPTARAQSASSPDASQPLPTAPSTLLAISAPAPSLLGEFSSSSAPDPADPFQHKPIDRSDVAKTPTNKPIAPLYTKYIPAGWVAQPIDGREKLIIGARDLYSPANFVAIFVSAGYSHLTDAQPNYGTDKGAFGQRLGAAAIRESAQGILTDGVFSVAFHQDPRYYDEGHAYNPVHRTLYAITRPLITRNDSGKQAINYSLLSAYGATAVLNNAYYPSSNRNVHDTFASFGGSIGGAALGFFVTEFQDDALKFLHLKRKP